MRGKAKAGTWDWMARVALLGVLLGALAGCGLDAKACTVLRTQAFDILNEPHTCNDDIDCIGSEWPGCTKPLSKKNRGRMAPMRQQFDDGKCVEKEQECREPPEIYCKQGLCVFNEKSIR